MPNKETFLALAALGFSLVGCGEESTTVLTRIPSRPRTILPVPLPIPSATKIIEDCPAGKPVTRGAIPFTRELKGNNVVFKSQPLLNFYSLKRFQPVLIGGQPLSGNIVGTSESGVFCETNFIFSGDRDKSEITAYQRIR